MGYYKNLIAYRKAFELAIEIYTISKSFPAEERYSLTSQIRSSSRSVCANIAEAYKRKRFRNYYISKLNDAEAENAETEVWLEFAKEFSYLDEILFSRLLLKNSEVGKLIRYMIQNPEKFL